MESWTVAGAALLGAVLGSQTSCGSSSFECSADSECRVDTIEGWCEGTHFCSFPDLDCPSGREYGELAGGGLAGTCVPVEQDTDPSGSGSGTSTGTSTGSDPTESELGDSSGDAPTGCPGEVFDDFGDGVLGSQWNAFGFIDGQEGWVEETTGAMQVTIPAGADGYAGIALNDLLELGDGRVRIEVEAPPGPASSIIVAVGSLMASPGSQLLLYLYQDDAALGWQPDGRVVEPLTEYVPLSLTQTPWVELQLVGSGPGASTSVRVSEDGTNFSDLVSTTHEVPLEGSVLFIYAQSFEPEAQAGDMLRVSTVSACPG